ncbi:MAG TPA: tetratricopeptide repeat protein [Acidobacteriota bacterium]|nr:tetratricopeptide repeat protein [Acidobacteriota bacterium]
MKKAAFFLLLTFLSLPLAAQGPSRDATSTLQVKVMKAPGEDTLPQSMMLSVFSNTGYYSQEIVHPTRGNVYLDGLKTGSYTLRLESPGRETVETIVRIDSGFSTGSRKTVTIRLGKPRVDAELPPTDESKVSAAWLDLPKDVRKEIDKGDQAAAKKDHEKAVKHYLKALKKKPDVFHVYNNLSVEYLALGQPDRAIEALHKSAEIAPDQPVVYRNLGAIHLDLSQPQEAIGYLKKAAQMDAQDQETAMFMGEAHYQQEDFGQALAWFQKSERDSGNSAEFYVYTGNCNLRTGNYQEAIRRFEQFLEVESEGSRADSVRDVLAKVKAFIQQQ